MLIFMGKEFKKKCTTNLVQFCWDQGSYKKQKVISTKLHKFVNSSEKNHDEKMPHEFHERDMNIILSKDKKTYVCPYCDRKITLYHNLKTHIEKTHPNEKIGEKIYKKDDSNKR